jgi:choline dehydrogenase
MYFFSLLPFFHFAALSGGNAVLHRRASGVQTDPMIVDGHTFDYIVIGGGLSGLTVASRLSENATKTILVIEAGADNRNDPRVFDLHKFGLAIGSELDWGWNTVQGRPMVGCV